MFQTSHWENLHFHFILFSDFDQLVYLIKAEVDIEFDPKARHVEETDANFDVVFEATCSGNLFFSICRKEENSSGTLDEEALQSVMTS